jgi:hypothetical protein
MRDLDDFDPALFGVWTEGHAYDGLGADIGDAWSDAECRRQAVNLLLETKSAEMPPEDLRRLMNDMTREMREQFDHFRRLRASAEELCGPDADEAAAKAARADIKAATDAMSLIVRTLEKIDALQRQLARDREMEAERNADSLDYEEKKRRLQDLIERQVREKVEASIKQREPDHPGAGETGDETRTGLHRAGSDPPLDASHVHEPGLVLPEDPERA